MKKFNFKNESGDRKYFTQIPNIIVNHSTAYEQSLYLIMKRLAGEGGNCYASLNFLARKMAVDKKTVSKIIDKLLVRGWIKETEKTKLLGGRVRTFVIVDLWKINLNNYESGSHVTTCETGSNKDESGCKIPESGCQRDTNNNIDNIDKNKLLNDYKNGERRYQPYFLGDPMRWKENKKKLYVINKYNEWLEFAGNESDIEWREKG